MLKPLASLVVASSILFAGCAGAGSQSQLAPSKTTSGYRLTPYSTTRVTSPRVQAATNRAAVARNKQTSIGQVPDIDVGVDLTDAPLFGASQINLAVVGVNATSGGTVTPIIAYSSPVVVNVLDYQSTALILGGSSIPAGSYDGLQLVIDPSLSSVVTTGGQTLPVSLGSIVGGSFVASTTSPQTVSYPLAFSGAGGSSVNLLLDFSAENSILLTGSSAEIAPVLGGTDESSAVAIVGSLVSAGGTPVQNATVVVTDGSGNLAGVAPSDQYGNFQVNWIGGGTYTVTVENAYTTLAGAQLNASNGRTDSLAPVTVHVPAGNEVNLGQIGD